MWLTQKKVYLDILGRTNTSFLYYRGQELEIKLCILTLAFSMDIKSFYF